MPSEKSQESVFDLPPRLQRKADPAIAPSPLAQAQPFSPSGLTSSVTENLPQLAVQLAAAYMSGGAGASGRIAGFAGSAFPMELGAAQAAGASANPLPIDFDFFAMPVAVEGAGHVERVVVERTRLDPDGRAVGTGERYALPARLVVSCIGYRTPPIPGVPYDERAGRFISEDGRMAPGLYCVGWARRGPSGTIGTNRPDGYAIADLMAQDIGEGSGREGRAGLDRLLEEREIDIVTFRDWQKIEQAELARARDGAPREKFTSIAEMIAAIGGG